MNELLDFILIYFIIAPLVLTPIWLPFFLLSRDVRRSMKDGMSFLQAFKENNKPYVSSGNTSRCSTRSDSGYSGYTSSDYTSNPSFYNLPSNINNHR